jgi:hypothetical protein
MLFLNGRGDDDADDELDSNSMRDMHDLLHNNRTTLDLARLGLEDMVPKYPALAPGDMDSRASLIGSDASLFGGRDSILTNTEFVFDEVLFGSRAYRHTVARVSAKNNTPGARSNYPNLATVHESGTEERTGSANTPSVVTSDVHEAVLMKLRGAEERIRILEERMQHQGATTPRPQEAAQNQPHIVLESEGKLSRPQGSIDNVITDMPREGARMPGHSTRTKSSVISPQLMAAEPANYARPSPPRVPKGIQPVVDQGRQWLEPEATDSWTESKLRGDAGALTAANQSSTTTLEPPAVAILPIFPSPRDVINARTEQLTHPVVADRTGDLSGELVSLKAIQRAKPYQTSPFFAGSKSVRVRLAFSRGIKISRHEERPLPGDTSTALANNAFLDDPNPTTSLVKGELQQVQDAGATGQKKDPASVDERSGNEAPKVQLSLNKAPNTLGARRKENRLPKRDQDGNVLRPERAPTLEGQVRETDSVSAVTGTTGSVLSAEGISVPVSKSGNPMKKPPQIHSSRLCQLRVEEEARSSKPEKGKGQVEKTMAGRKKRRLEKGEQRRLLMETWIQSILTAEKKGGR